MSEGTYTPPIVPGAGPNLREGSVTGSVDVAPNGPSNKISSVNLTKPSATPQASDAKPTASNSVGIQWGILLVLSAIPLAVWAFAPSYGNTILTAFFTTLSIFGGILCLIAAVSIMMNIYKTDGTPIMLMMGFLGMFASPFIVFGYWIYHVWAWTQSIKPRPYFGLFPIGFHGSPGSFWDSFLGPFHDTSNDKKVYEALVADAKSILYGGPRD